MQGGVWRVSLATISPQCLVQAEVMLDETERERIAAIKHPQRRKAFIIGRALARCAYLHCYPDADKPLAMIEGVYGRPELRVVQPFDFNLSHAGDWCVCAFTTQGRVGVDIEAHRAGRDIDGIAQHCFHNDERRLMDMADEPQQCFYQLWVLKEALLKMLGLGLRIPLQQVCFTLQQEQWCYCGEQPAVVALIQLEQWSDYQLAVISDQPDVVQLPSIELNMESVLG